MAKKDHVHALVGARLMKCTDCGALIMIVGTDMTEVSL